MENDYKYENISQYNALIVECSDLNRIYKELVSCYNDSIEIYNKIINLSSNTFDVISKVSSPYQSKSFYNEYYDKYEKSIRRASQLANILKNTIDRLFAIESPDFITYLIRVYTNHEKKSVVSKELKLTDYHKTNRIKQDIENTLNKRTNGGNLARVDEDINCIEEFIESFNKPIKIASNGSLSQRKEFFKKYAKNYNYYQERIEILSRKIDQDKTNRTPNDSIDIGYYIEYQHSLAIKKYVESVYVNVRKKYGLEVSEIIKDHYSNGFKNMDLAKKFNVEYRTIVNWQNKYLDEFI